MPEWKEEITRRLRSLKLAPVREAEIVEEVAQHLENRYQELVAGGTAEAEARRVALEELSDENLLARGLRRVEQEVTQEPTAPGRIGRNNLLESIWQDLRYGLRMLRRNPGFAAVAVTTLALGIGLNTVIFSMVNGLLLRSLPVRQPAQIYTLSAGMKGGAFGNVFSYQDLEEIRKQTGALFSDVAGVHSISFTGLSVGVS